MLPEDKQKFLTLPNEAAMTIVIAGEARGEPDDGKIMIASVVLNRADYGTIHHGWGNLYGNSIKSVIVAPNQFSCLNSNDPNYSLLMEISEFFVQNNNTDTSKWPWLGICHAIAVDVISGKTSRNCHGIYYESIASSKDPHGLMAQYKAQGKTPEIEGAFGSQIVYTLASTT